MASLLSRIFGAPDGSDMPLGDKAELRRRARAARDGMGDVERAEAGAKIAEQLAARPEWERCSLVLAYLSVGSEVETRDIIRMAWEAGKAVALPRCDAEAHGLAWVRVDSLEGLVPGAYGIEEPPASAPALGASELGEGALALVPGLLFDERCYRIGMGGGYYDRFLANFTGTSVGLSYRTQLVESLDALGVLEPYDRPVDVVLFDKSSTDMPFAR